MLLPIAWAAARAPMDLKGRAKVRKTLAREPDNRPLDADAIRVGFFATLPCDISSRPSRAGARPPAGPFS